MLDIGYEAAWFMAHRIREAMRDGGLAPLGGGGGIVEADETYFGKQDEPNAHLKQRRGRPFIHKGRRPDGQARRSLLLSSAAAASARFMSQSPTSATVPDIVRENIARETRLHTDESKLYIRVGARVCRA